MGGGRHRSSIITKENPSFLTKESLVLSHTCYQVDTRRKADCEHAGGCGNASSSLSPADSIRFCQCKKKPPKTKTLLYCDTATHGFTKLNFSKPRKKRAQNDFGAARLLKCQIGGEPFWKRDRKKKKSELFFLFS